MFKQALVLHEQDKVKVYDRKGNLVVVHDPLPWQPLEPAQLEEAPRKTMAKPAIFFWSVAVCAVGFFLYGYFML